MGDWNPELYRTFEDERTRPAMDLLAHVPLADPESVFDLGCGPGNSTGLLKERFARAEVAGIDSSPAMIAAARKRLPDCRFTTGDIATWQPAKPLSLIYANASLHWVPDHETLIPRLVSLLAPGGVLAVQMPDNEAEPTHRLMREIAEDGPWTHAIRNSGVARAATLTLTEYYDILAPLSARVDLWRTVYHHQMASAEAIVTWFEASGLRPFLAPLSEKQRGEFLRSYERGIARAYPERRGGLLLLPFPRKFFIATAPG